MTPDEQATAEYDTLEAMRIYGGSFVQAIAVAAQRADPWNLARLKAAFPEVWEKYREMATWRRVRPPST